MQCIRSNFVKSIMSLKEKSHLHFYKDFVNGENESLISPLFVNGKLVTNFSEKANIFNDFFSQQYWPILNDSVFQ